MIEPRGSRRGRRAAEALPGVQPDVVMVTARRNEGCLVTVPPLGQLKAENAAVEPQRPFQVSHLEVDVTDADLGVDGASSVVGGHGVIQGDSRQTE